MVSVGVLAAIVNVVILLIVAIVDRIIELGVRNFAASRLRRDRKAPVVHDSDTWLPNIPRSVVKYHRHPAILLTVLCAGFLIGSEMITELGVAVSNTCSPVMRHAKVITHNDSKNSFTVVELGTSAFFLQTTTFVDGELKRVPSGLPRSIKGSVCFPCMPPEQYPDIMSGCSVTEDRVYGPGQLIVSLVTTTGPFKTITNAMNETSGSRNFTGRGDLTYNGVHWSAFLFYTSDDGDLIYLEYSNQEHLSNLTTSARENENNALFGPIESNVVARRIKCSTNLLNQETLRDAVAIYRTIQLENTINPAVFVPEREAFNVNLAADDVYRAGLSVKIIDDDWIDGDYFEYTTCGRYNWVFLIPIGIISGCILLLFFLSWAIQIGYEARRIPYNSRSWFRYFQETREASKKSRGRPAAARSGYFDTIFDEMVVLEEGRGSPTKIGLRSRDGRISPLASGQNFAFMNDYHSNMQLASEVGRPGDVVLATEGEVPSQPDDIGDPVAIAAVAPYEYLPDQNGAGRW